MKLIIAVTLLTAACTAATPPAPGAMAPAQTQAAQASAAVGLGIYEGTYALQAPSRVIELRVWVDAEGRLNGEMVGSGQQTVFRPSTGHRFLHAMRDDIWVQFNVENGRATSATMGQAGREISGPRRA